MAKAIQVAFDMENADHVSVTQLQQGLTRLAESLNTTLAIVSIDVVTYEATEKMENTVILAMSYAEEEPYFVVQKEGDWPDEGQTLQGKALNDLVVNSVCVRLHSRYPNAERYGVPEHAYSERKAAQFVAEQGFKVAPTLDVSAEDSYDDSPEIFWLTFKTT